MNNHTFFADRDAAQTLVGTWRRFGRTGPVYEIVGISEPTSDNVVRMKVRVLRTDETVDYELSDLLQDPKEA